MAIQTAPCFSVAGITREDDSDRPVNDHQLPTHASTGQPGPWGISDGNGTSWQTMATLVLLYSVTSLLQHCALCVRERFALFLKIVVSGSASMTCTSLDPSGSVSDAATIVHLAYPPHHGSYPAKTGTMTLPVVLGQHLKPQKYFCVMRSSVHGLLAAAEHVYI